MKVRALVQSVAGKLGLENNQKVEKFLKVAVGDFVHVGAVFPSSRWATNAVVKHIPAGSRVVVEYGPGSGAVTNRILSRLDKEAQVFGIEVNPNFVEQLGALGDDRLKVVHGDVAEVSSRLREYSSAGVDAVISGIPFSFLSCEDRDAIVRRTRKGLRPGGRFILYQNSPKMMEYLKSHFTEVKCLFEPRNVFPYFIMIATA